MLKARLPEKTKPDLNALLQEMNHRVRTYLSIIDSIIHLEKSINTSGKKDSLVLDNISSRIHAIALVHEKLCGSKNFNTVCIKDYIEGLAQRLYKSHAVIPEHIIITVDAEPLFLDIDICVSLGIIITELITNTFCHAFPKNESDQEKEKRVGISFFCENCMYKLMVKDNGIGFKKGIYIYRKKTLGLTLVKVLAEQLNGNFGIASEDETVFSIQFPIMKRIKQ